MLHADISKFLIRLVGDQGHEMVIRFVASDPFPLTRVFVMLENLSAPHIIVISDQNTTPNESRASKSSVFEKRTLSILDIVEAPKKLLDEVLASQLMKRP